MDRWKNRLFGSLHPGNSKNLTTSGSNRVLKSSTSMKIPSLKKGKKKGYKSPIIKAKDNFDEFYESIKSKRAERPSDFKELFMENSVSIQDMFPYEHLRKLKETIEITDIQNLDSEYREVLQSLACAIQQSIEQEN